jgi:poly(hydroxyalkanoate) depolymerase family esterase
MKPILNKLLDEAAGLTRLGPLKEATATIQHAIGSGSSARAASAPRSRAAVLGGAAPALPVLGGAAPALPVLGGAKALLQRLRPQSRQRLTKPADDDGADVEGSFAEGSYSGRSGTRLYKLFVPAGSAARRRGLIVMLHGCTQSPDDFAAGTGMNDLGQERGFLVLYPAQAPRSNSNKCWNWFVPGDQRRGAGEPELLAGMARELMARHNVDPARVYVAGLSAGGAMADILGREYPDLFAAVGVHSGLPQGAAHDVSSAFAAMHGGGMHGGPVTGSRRSPGSGRGAPAATSAPTIVFHGDRDSTVHPSNGEQVIDSLVSTIESVAGPAVASTAKSSAAGRTVTRTVHRRRGAAAAEPSVAEHWVVHGAGHAWSGGDPRGSYTDANGPDASLEMVRFFEEHPLRRH